MSRRKVTINNTPFCEGDVYEMQGVLVRLRKITNKDLVFRPIGVMEYGEGDAGSGSDGDSEGADAQETRATTSGVALVGFGKVGQ